MMSRKTRETSNSLLDSKEKISGGNSVCLRNLPMRDNGEPKTASAGENPESSLGEDWRQSITRGRRETQSEPANLAQREDLRERRKRVQSSHCSAGENWSS